MMDAPNAASPFQKRHLGDRADSRRAPTDQNTMVTDDTPKVHSSTRNRTEIDSVMRAGEGCTSNAGRISRSHRQIEIQPGVPELPVGSFQPQSLDQAQRPAAQGQPHQPFLSRAHSAR